MKRNLAIVAAIAAIVAVALWGHSAYREHQTRTRIVAMVMDASGRLKPALAAETSDFDAASEIVGRNTDALVRRRHFNVSLQPLAEAAGRYVGIVGQLLGRRAAMQSAAERQSKALEAVRQHSRSDGGRADLPGETVRLRENLDRAFQHYRNTVDIFCAYLDVLPEVQSKMAAQVKDLPLVDDKSIEAARAAARAALSRAADNIRTTTQLDVQRDTRR